MKQLNNIRLLDEAHIAAFLKEQEEPGFRARQINEWLWKKSAHNFEQMSNLPLSLRQKLQNNFSIDFVSINTKQVSNDGTIKLAFKLFDNNIVEGVLIPSNGRMTACISSQVGCSLDCSFCATAQLKRVRNLNFDEIYDQVVLINNLALEHYNTRLTNIVFMGMGEPLLNYANTIKGIEKITGDEGLGMAARRITVSTAGIAKIIKKMGEEKVRFNLALSLHAPSDEKRSKIMSINETNNLDALKDALHYFYNQTNTRVTYEYVMLKDFNDTIEDAKQLAAFCKIIPCKVNLIEYNTTGDGKFSKSASENTEAFKAYLENKNIIVNIRRSRGEDIDAACGQLANKSV